MPHDLRTRGSASEEKWINTEDWLGPIGCSPAVLVSVLFATRVASPFKALRQDLRHNIVGVLIQFWRLRVLLEDCPRFKSRQVIKFGCCQ